MHRFLNFLYRYFERLNSCRPNRTVYLASVFVFLPCFSGFGITTAYGQSAIPTAARIEIISFHSEVFENDRNLRIWLPPGYGDDPRRTYPVLFMNDGQNLFDAETSFYTFAEWRMDETALALINAGEIEPLVIVGIDNAGRRDRPNEYLPWEDEYLTPPVPDPQGDQYPDFLFDEVIPFVEQNYRVLSEPEGRGLGGASYGGLISIYTTALHGDKIGKLLLESASAYVNDGAVLDLAEQANAWPERVYIGIGTHEGATACRADNVQLEPIADMRRLQSILLHFDPRMSLEVVIEECGIHHEDAYARRLPNALRFLYGPD
ncbi:MAG: hypothetical protein MI746_14815 [Pseudomonadales bacterium]|nr:hypothetical protein [Pseudomonadales bacterium]